jgi:hypothetical protein
MRNNQLGAPTLRYWNAGSVIASLVLILTIESIAFAQAPVGPSQPLITQPINESSLVVLSGNTPPGAKSPSNDRGIVPDDLPLAHMMMQLRRPSAQEQALEILIDQLHDPHSPNYQH